MIVTTLSTRLLDEYGRHTVATWAVHTAHRVCVVVHPDEMQTFRAALGPAFEIRPFSVHSMAAMGRIRAEETRLAYRPDDYRFQASRFSWKVYAIHEACSAFPDEPSLVWLDADSLIRPGFDTWLKGVVSAEQGASYLGRAHKQLHAETGLMQFVGAEGRRLFERVLQVYETLALFEYAEWHDAYIFTSVLQFSRHGFDIARHRGVRSSNPLHEIDRGRHIVHLKGARKQSASKLLDDLRVWFRR